MSIRAGFVSTRQFAIVLCILVMQFAAGAVCANIETYRQADPRLEKKVTIEMNHAKLEDVVESLAEQSGVGVKAGTGGRDWKVRERKVTIHAKEIPLGQMLDEVSHVTGFLLSREGKEGEWGYVIWQDLKRRLLEDEMLIAAREADAKRMADMRRAAIDRAEAALKMTPEEAMKQRRKSPMTAFMGGTRSGRGFARVLSALQSEFSTEYELMMRGKRVTIPVSSLPSWLEDAVQDMMTGRFLFSPEAAEQLTPTAICIGRAYGPGSDLFTPAGLAGVMTLDTVYTNDDRLKGMPSGQFPMSGSDFKLVDVFGEYALMLEEGADPEEAREHRRGLWDDPEGVAGMFDWESPTEEEPPTDPELTREIEILEVHGGLRPGTGFRETEWAEDHGRMMAEIARAADVSVLLESYAGMMPVGTFIKEGKQPFYSVLIAAEKAGCLWEMGDGTLRIRPRDWAIHRTREIPQSFVNHFQSLVDKGAEFTLDEVASIASALTDAQLDGGLNELAELGVVLRAMMSQRTHRDVLRAYGSMSPSQKSLALSENGIPFAQLTDQQWTHLQEIISEALGGEQITGGALRITDPEETAEQYQRYLTLELSMATQQGSSLHSTSVLVPSKAMVKSIYEEMRRAREDRQKTRVEGKR